ncbi:FMN-dependent NADH-azoreductase [Chromobacterium sp. IIBBL 290-4]|uniref:FMN-dependent NADH-azoreductase n=1 Tax=Chromobacterium sp. IIBBL 290-4 TaxID=2953890 RepID=UPI0020B8924C|nr:NAD(P)H-dependent oxidoreductase [Chromobacterium sp. IIBBL 290-4]UTH73878.1 NAD(P)H-dependent oxidoreductase [Chromobacterium sp. IIBBL 290-4]
MKTILHLSASPKLDDSRSRAAGERLCAALAEGRASRIVARDAARLPCDAVNSSFISASLTPAEQRVDSQLQALTLSEQLIAELEAANALVISTPLHNFALPAALKLWLDLVIRPNRTFRGGPAGKVGLLQNKPCFVIVASGGPLASDPGWQEDFLSPYLRYALACMGLEEVSFLQLDNQSRGEPARQTSAQRAEQWIKQQVDRFALPA